MANRFRGLFSPGRREVTPQALPLRAAPGHLRHRLESRTRWITAAASPLLVTAFFQDPIWLAANLAGFGLIWSGMALTREGLQAQAAYDARPAAQPPAYPRKLLGGVTAGLGLAIGAAEPGALAGAGVIGGVGLALHWLTFGSDPMRAKGMEGAGSFQHDRIARVVAEAEQHLAAMQTAIARTRDGRLEDVVHDFSDKARSLYARIEADPAQLPAARRYLGVWLLGARDATTRFADLYAGHPDEAARLDWLSLMADLTNEFAARSAQMMAGGRADMDIEIAVLRDRLAREGLAAKASPVGAPGPTGPEAEAQARARAEAQARARQTPARPQLRDDRGLDELFRMPEPAGEAAPEAPDGATPTADRNRA